MGNYMLSISRRVFNVICREKISCFQPWKFSRRISLIATSSAGLAPPNSTKHHCSSVLIFKMSQKSITSFFTRKAPVYTTAVSSSDGDGGNIAKPTTASKTPTKNKEQKNIIDEDKKQVQNSPLREPNRIKDENELSLDSPIKQTKKARKRIESSSEGENGNNKIRFFWRKKET